MLLGLHVRQHWCAEGRRPSSARYDHDQRFVREAGTWNERNRFMLLSFQDVLLLRLGQFALLPVPLRRLNGSLARKTRSRKNPSGHREISAHFLFFRTDAFRPLPARRKKV